MTRAPEAQGDGRRAAASADAGTMPGARAPGPDGEGGAPDDPAAMYRFLVGETLALKADLASIREALGGLPDAVAERVAESRPASLAAAQGDPGGDRLEKAARRIEEQVRVCVRDFHRWQETSRLCGPGRLRTALVAAALPVLFALGVLVEQRYQVIPVHDPTGGWKDHVWNRYGADLVDCTQRIAAAAGGGRCSVTFSARE